VKQRRWFGSRGGELRVAGNRAKTPGQQVYCAIWEDGGCWFVLAWAWFVRFSLSFFGVFVLFCKTTFQLSVRPTSPPPRLAGARRLHKETSVRSSCLTVSKMHRSIPIQFSSCLVCPQLHATILGSPLRHPSAARERVPRGGIVGLLESGFKPRGIGQPFGPLSFCLRTSTDSGLRSHTDRGGC